MKTTQLSIALLFTWLLSPESLALNSKFAGIAGHTAIIFFVLGGGLVLFCTSQMYHPQLAASGFATDSQIFTQVWGRFSGGLNPAWLPYSVPVAWRDRCAGECWFCI